MNLPADYKLGFEKARAVAPEMADNYVAHTSIGDPVAEAMTEDLAELGQAESTRLIEAAMNEEGEDALRNAPASLRRFFKDAETPPEWLDYSAFAPGVRMFHRNSQVILAAFVAGVLIEGFTTNIAKSFFITGRVRDQGVRRLGQNNRHMMEIFLPGGLYRQGDGWKRSVRIRLEIEIGWAERCKERRSFFMEVMALVKSGIATLAALRCPVRDCYGWAKGRRRKEKPRRRWRPAGPGPKTYLFNPATGEYVRRDQGQRGAP